MAGSSSVYPVEVLDEKTPDGGTRDYDQTIAAPDSYERTVSQKWQGTETDRRDMSALGRVQELRVCDQALNRAHVL